MFPVHRLGELSDGTGNAYQQGIDGRHEYHRTLVPDLSGGAA